MSETQTPPRTTAVSSETRAVVRRLFCLVLSVAALGFALQVFLLTPVYVRFASDITYADAWWVNVLYYITQEGILDLVIFAVCYAASAYAVFAAGFKGALRIPVVYALLTAAKFFLNFVMNAITDSALPDMEEFLSYDLIIILWTMGLELLQYALVVLFAALIKARYDSRVRIAEGMMLLPRERRVDYPMPEPPFPYRKLLSVKNPLQLIAFLSALLLFTARFGMQMLYQVTLFLKYGSSDGWVVMLIDLISDLAIAVVFYFVFLLLFGRFHDKETEAA